MSSIFFPAHWDSSEWEVIKRWPQSGPLSVLGFYLCACVHSVTASCHAKILLALKASSSLVVGQLFWVGGWVVSHWCRWDEWAEGWGSLSGLDASSCEPQKSRVCQNGYVSKNNMSQRKQDSFPSHHSVQSLWAFDSCPVEDPRYASTAERHTQYAVGAQKGEPGSFFKFLEQLNCICL